MRNYVFLLIALPFTLLGQINNFQWPMAPVDQQHRISATLDECREDRDHFHNGTDMPLAPGGEALSMMNGSVTGIGSDWIRVGDFAYVHVDPNPALLIGNSVSLGAVVGWTDSYAHIHLNYGGGASGYPYGNPLLPGKITPFNDPYHPRSPIIQLVMDGMTTPFSNNSISGRVDIIAQAADTTDLQAPIDKNNGIYTIGWALHSADTNTVLEGPHFWFEANEWFSSSYIKNIYAPGSSTSIYKYIVTNKVTSNSYLDCDLYTPGNYVISVMSSDTRDNWDTTYVPVYISDEDLMPPGQPVLNYVGPNAAGDLHFEWTPPTDADLAGYVIEYSQDSTYWETLYDPSVLTAGMESYTVSEFAIFGFLKFRIRAVDDAPTPNMSEYSDTYAVNMLGSNDNILIVDGFDRKNGSWTKNQHDFSAYYASALVRSGSDATITSVSNDWVINGGNLAGYQSVFWFLGDESTVDETFSNAEQNTISAYLAGGGHLFASGSEIAWDIGVQGSSTDKVFLNTVLRLHYSGDDAGDYHINGFGDHFSGLSMNYGSSPYPEDYPDYFGTLNGGEVVLKYGNGRTAAVGYRDGTSSSFVMGFPFETIDTPEHRSQLMSRVLTYFGSTTSVDHVQVPITFSISDIYPNPFNASVNVKYQLESAGNVDLAIYDIRGRKVFEQHLLVQQPGTYSWLWNGADNAGKILSSGSYLIRLTQDKQYSITGKLLLLK